jgi:hypothetical protein
MTGSKEPLTGHSVSGFDQGRVGPDGFDHLGGFFHRGAGLAVKDGGDPDFVAAQFGFEIGKGEASGLFGGQQGFGNGRNVVMI